MKLIPTSLVLMLFVASCGGNSVTKNNGEPTKASLPSEEAVVCETIQYNRESVEACGKYRVTWDGEKLTVEQR